jgi:hypothetical protein
MFIGESLESHPRVSPPAMQPLQVIGLLLGGAYILGMFAALKFERAGARLSGVLALVFGLPVLLYSLCWWLESRDCGRLSAR